MGRAPCCNGEHSGLNKGPWSHDEDEKLKSFIFQNPNTSWRMVPPKAGLLRCGKSCRLRWMNYLRPDIRRGNFTPEEENLIIQLHAAVGNKWAVIASQLSGRTDNEIKNLWNTKLRKVLVLKGINPVTHEPLCNPLLSDYIKQWVKSIENAIISGLITNSSTSNTNISTAATNENTSSSSINIPSLDEFLAPYMSPPSDPTLTTKLPDQPHLLGTKSDGPTFESKSWIGESSQSNHENLIVDDFMLEGEACLSNNLSEYLRDDFCEDSVTSADPLNLVDHFDYWDWS